MGWTSFCPAQHAKPLYRTLLASAPLSTQRGLVSRQTFDPVRLLYVQEQSQPKEQLVGRFDLPASPVLAKRQLDHHILEKQ